MKTRVFDSWPILEWGLGRHPAVEIVDTLLESAERGETRLFMSAINVGEIYYFERKNHSAAAAEYWRASAPTLPLTIEVPTMDEIWKSALLKGLYRISYADAFAAALAQKYNCPVITGDPEFLGVEDLQVEWIGKRE